MSIEEECINYLYIQNYFLQDEPLRAAILGREENKVQTVPAVLLLRPTYPSNSCLYKERNEAVGSFVK